MRTAIYLTFITVAVALWLTAVPWLFQLGSGLYFSALLITGRFGGGKAFMTLVGFLLVLGALAMSIWQFEVALRFGHLWQRFSLPWWLVGVIFLAWISVMVKELRRKKTQ
jgi:hypothetical protein